MKLYSVSSLAAYFSTDIVEDDSSARLVVGLMVVAEGMTLSAVPMLTVELVMTECNGDKESA